MERPSVRLPVLIGNTRCVELSRTATELGDVVVTAVPSFCYPQRGVTQAFSRWSLEVRLIDRNGVSYLLTEDQFE